MLNKQLQTLKTCPIYDMPRRAIVFILLHISSMEIHKWRSAVLMIGVCHILSIFRYGGVNGY